MGKNALRYDQMVEEALRGVVRKALSQVAENGLPGAHHFYITFETDHPGVSLSDSLRARYPEEMTIILQHQFWGLEVEEDGFSVTLSFNDRHERVGVPFEAITAFADPAVKFGLRFEAQEAIGATDAGPAAPEPAPVSPKPELQAEPAPGEGAKIVALETFRKK
ncbi:MAG: ClpXP protease specificity-enhancing factor SspB [Rhodospirillales bacterium]|nr:ClpXP protease specificity-enhancing factor SspB [Rhodospirillales bacterium]